MNNMTQHAPASYFNEQWQCCGFDHLSDEHIEFYFKDSAELLGNGSTHRVQCVFLSKAGCYCGIMTSSLFFAAILMWTLREVRFEKDMLHNLRLFIASTDPTVQR